MLGIEHAIWNAGDWVVWDDIDGCFAVPDRAAERMNTELSTVDTLRCLLSTAENFFRLTGRHLHVYGDIGQLYATIILGLQVDQPDLNDAPDGAATDLVEVKTIAPFRSGEYLTVRRKGPFSKLFVVRISDDFQLSGKLIDRNALPRVRSARMRLSLEQIEAM